MLFYNRILITRKNAGNNRIPKNKTVSYFILFALAILIIIIRFITYKPLTGSEVLEKKAIRQRKQPLQVPEYSQENLEHYPYGPFYLIWQYNQYNDNAAQHSSPYFWEEQNFGIKDVLKTYILTDYNDNHYGFINKFMTNVEANSDYTKLAIWVKESGKPEIRVSIVDLKKVTPIQRISKDTPPSEDANWYFTPDAVTDFNIEIKTTTKPYPIDIPENISLCFPEIIIPVNVENIHDENSYHDSCLLILNTKEKIVTIYPQDWFNQQKLDFGYQWITVARRLPKSGYITVAAMRTGYFLLDNTYRNLLKK